MPQPPAPKFNGLYGDLIMDHYRNPRNRDPLPAPTIEASQFNPFCGDRIDLQLKLDPHGKTQAVSARAEGCTIIQASASLMSQAIQNRTPNEIRQLTAHVRQMMQTKTPDPTPNPQLGDLTALTAIRQYPIRIKCALLPWVALETAYNKIPSPTHITKSPPP